jgi:hypothetical protein
MKDFVVTVRLITVRIVTLQVFAVVKTAPTIRKERLVRIMYSATVGKPAMEWRPVSLVLHLTVMMEICVQPIAAIPQLVVKMIQSYAHRERNV